MKHMKSLINGGFFAFLTNEHLRMNCSQRITYMCVILFNTIQLFFCLSDGVTIRKATTYIIVGVSTC